MAKTDLPLAILDFVAITGDASAKETIDATIEVAKHADRLGYHRYWVPEHHNHLGLAFTSSDVMITRLLDATEKIRVGAAGVMLPNHAPLKVAEDFRTLEVMFPGRIDLGLGRAPGTDGLTAHALRNGQTHENFGEQAGELFAFLHDAFPDEHPYSKVVAAPRPTGTPDIFMLGSSDYGPRFAAVNGLIAVFAHHMSPQYAAPLLRQYREQFQPGPYLDAPYSIVSALAFATEDPELADAALATWMLFKDNLTAGRRGPRASLAEALDYTRTDEFAARKPSNEKLLFVGKPDDVGQRLHDLAAECQVDELAVISPLGEQQPRLESFTAIGRKFGL